MQFTQIKETCLYVKDLDRTQTFYHGKLQLKLISREEGRHIFFKAGSSLLLCFIAEATRHDSKLPAHYGEGRLHMAFEVPRSSYREVKERILSEGISIEHEQYWGNDFYSFYFRDPDGHSLEIVPAGMWE